MCLCVSVGVRVKCKGVFGVHVCVWVCVGSVKVCMCVHVGVRVKCKRTFSACVNECVIRMYVRVDKHVLACICKCI